MLTDALRAQPTGLTEALALIDGLDDALVHGLARIDEDRAAALESLAEAFNGSPLAGRVSDSIGKIVSGTVTDEHLAALAGARSALLGAAHDALLGTLSGALGRDRLPSPPSAAGPVIVAGGSRSWLRELAIAGWRGVDHELASAGSPAVQALLADPAARRLAVLLDGFAAELRAAAPVATLERIPVRRWADLWSRALLLSQDGFPADPGEPVDGRFLLLGLDLHEHPTVFRAQAHGLLETAGGDVRLVRVSVAAPKVETITGPSAWRMLAGFPIFRAAVAEHRAVEVSGLTLTGGGDLIWDESRVTAGEPADPFATARVRLGAATAFSATPLDRHPAAIAEPVLLEGYTPGPDALDLGGVSLPIDTDRLPVAGPLTPALIAASTACIGLLRWDAGRWLVQPLAVQASVKKKAVAVHTGDWALGPLDAKAAKAEAVAGTAVDVLRERAGRLLRK
ncbi:hypothetical protein FB565_002221 [Actinoplanes lutulentus]|uniref:Uncharacterized protein n=1 Tax=Actinoplanes lutulentus TaxID=1287878 RepID=A0A327ZDU2_9ACTN|nr:hypothetical protein [Actinoplanes lutulentus]MBB2942508.1 hypothetical protein [Actinoplanes lutulentus]RAK38089.1 hypothetical protein B0I29_10535 [Actinoplanes lutulentus]